MKSGWIALPRPMQFKGARVLNGVRKVPTRGTIIKAIRWT